jgi:hypothetical protein
MCASVALGSAAGAASGAPANGGISGVKGDPQPEIKPFKIAGVGYGGGNAAIEPNGALVVAYSIANGDGKSVVCVLDRGASKCSSTVTLSPLDGDDLEGIPSVFAPSANHVVVLMSTCCDDAANGDTLVFTSTNGGRTFAAPVRVGSVDPNAAEQIGGQIVFEGAATGFTDGVEVQSIPALGAAAPPAAFANPFTATSYAQGVGSYKGGALIGTQYDGSVDSTYVKYAPAGQNFNASGSYHSVGSFSNEELIGMSGDALLTEAASGALRVRLFNGAKFGPAHVVPALGPLTGPAWWALDTDPRGQVHVFSARSSAPVSYALYMQSSWTGASWSSPLNLGNAIDSDYFGSALDSIGSGAVVGTTDHEPVWIYPVLAPQAVSFGLSKSTIGQGRTTVGSGKGSPVAKGRTVWLQQERSGTWWNVATTHESSSGSFSFTIKGSAAGTYDYRAVVSDFAGYLQYGYSAGRALKVS